MNKNSYRNNSANDAKQKLIIIGTIIVVVIIAIVFFLMKIVPKNKTSANNESNITSQTISSQSTTKSSGFSYENIPESPADVFDFVVTAENEICITKYKGNDDKVRLPEYINSLPVTSINKEVFTLNGTIRIFVFDENFKRINNNEYDTTKYAYNGVEGCGYFDGCTNLSTVYFGRSATKIDEDYFDWCNSLENIYVSDENPYYKSIDGMIYTKDETEFIVCPQKTPLTEIKLSDACRIVHSFAFEQCLGIEVINLNKANDIGELCFNGKEIYMLGDCKVVANTISDDMAKKVSVKFMSVISQEMRKYCTEKGVSFSYAE